MKQAASFAPQVDATDHNVDYSNLAYNDPRLAEKLRQHDAMKQGVTGVSAGVTLDPYAELSSLEQLATQYELSGYPIGYHALEMLGPYQNTDREFLGHGPNSLPSTKEAVEGHLLDMNVEFTNYPPFLTSHAGLYLELSDFWITSPYVTVHHPNDTYFNSRMTVHLSLIHISEPTRPY